MHSIKLYAIEIYLISLEDGASYGSFMDYTEIMTRNTEKEFGTHWYQSFSSLSFSPTHIVRKGKKIYYTERFSKKIKKLRTILALLRNKIFIFF